MRKFLSGASVEIFERLDSTSAEAKRRIAAGARGPSWIIALHQTAGYGRRGRAWAQESGDFAGSILFSTDADPGVLGQLSFVLALAVHDALSALVAKGDMRIKWPNDILVDGAKIAGLLLEMVDAAGARMLIAGIGVNVVSTPDIKTYPTTRLLNYESAPMPPALAEAIDANFWAHYKIWCADGFAPVRRAWLDRAVGVGEETTVRLPNETLTGVFEDLDDSGGLVLRFDGGTRIISAGDVYFGAPDKKSN